MLVNAEHFDVLKAVTRIQCYKVEQQAPAQEKREMLETIVHWLATA